MVHKFVSASVLTAQSLEPLQILCFCLSLPLPANALSLSLKYKFKKNNKKKKYYKLCILPVVGVVGEVYAAVGPEVTGSDVVTF